VVYGVIMPTDNSLPAFPLWRRALAYFTVAVMPVSINVEKLLHYKDKRYLSPLDFLLPLLLLVTLYDGWTQRKRASDQRTFGFPPISGLIWAGLAIVSCLWITHFPHDDTVSSWLRGVQGAVIFGLLAVWIFQNLAPDPAEYRRLCLILGVSCGVCLLLALRQYVGPMGLPFDPRNKEQELGGVTNIRLGGWYQFRGTLGALTALIAPAAAAYAVLDRDSAVRSIAFCIAGLALLVTLSAGGMLGAVAGIIGVIGALAAVRNWRAALYALAFLVIIVTVLLPHLPRNNPESILEGVTLYVGDVNSKIVPGARLRRYQAVVNLLNGRADPLDPASTPNWKRGVGSGQYQTRLANFYYGPYEKPSISTDDEAAFGVYVDEPFSFGLFETVAVELGVPGLIALLLLFGVWIAAAAGAFARLYSVSSNASHREAATLALAAFGAGCGGLVLSAFGNPAVRGPGSVFAFFFAVALCAQRWSVSLPERPAA
jgi:hypothetical protein